MTHFVLTSDLHLHKHNTPTRNKGLDRLQDGLSALQQTLAFADERDCPWVFLGDAKQLRGSWCQLALAGALDLFRQYKNVRKIMLCGNHDGVGLKDLPESGLKPFESEQNVTVVSYPIVFEFDKGVWVACWPWQPTFDGLPAFLAEARAQKARIIFGHCFLRGSRIGPTDLRLADAGVPLETFGLIGPPTKRFFDSAFFGDVHVAQLLGDRTGKTAATVVVPGSPMGLSWGEREDNKGCVYVQIDKGAMKLTLLPVKAPRYRVYDLTDSKTLDGVKVSDWENDFLRFLVPEGTNYEVPPEAKPRYVEIIPIRTPKKTDRKQSTMHAGLSPKELLKEYVETVEGPKGVTKRDLVTMGQKLMEGHDG